MDICYLAGDIVHSFSSAVTSHSHTALPGSKGEGAVGGGKGCEAKAAAAADSEQKKVEEEEETRARAAEEECVGFDEGSECWRGDVATVGPLLVTRGRWKIQRAYPAAAKRPTSSTSTGAARCWFCCGTPGTRILRARSVLDSILNADASFAHLPKGENPSIGWLIHRATPGGRFWPRENHSPCSVKVDDCCDCGNDNLSFCAARQYDAQTSLRGPDHSERVIPPEATFGRSQNAWCYNGRHDRPWLFAIIQSSRGGDGSMWLQRGLVVLGGRCARSLFSPWKVALATKVRCSANESSRRDGPAWSSTEWEITRWQHAPPHAGKDRNIQQSDGRQENTICVWTEREMRRSGRSRRRPQWRYSTVHDGSGPTTIDNPSSDRANNINDDSPPPPRILLSSGCLLASFGNPSPISRRSANLFRLSPLSLAVASSGQKTGHLTIWNSPRTANAGRSRVV